MYFYSFFTSVLILIQCYRSHSEVVARGNVTSYYVSDVAVHSVNGDVNRRVMASSDYCAEILSAFALAASDYTRCIVLHSREFTKCRSCAGHYVAADDMYMNITKAREKDSGSSCFAGNSLHQELVALSGVNDFIQTSWRTSLCSYCFVDRYSNGSHSTQLNNKTSDFFQLLSTFHGCVLNHTQGDIDPLIDRSNGTGNLSIICADCHSYYSPLNNLYQDLEDKDLPICSDMVNMMNLTRSLWNDLCHKVIFDVWAMVMVAILASIPPFFYIATAIKGKNPTGMIIRQKRWENVMLMNEPGGGGGGGQLLIDSDSQLSDQ